MMVTQKIPLWKQLLGALVGGVVAMSIYGIYEYASPHVASLIAWVDVDDTKAEEHVEIVVKQEGEKWDAIVSLTRQILEEKTDK